MIAGYDYLTLRWRMAGFWNRTRIAACALLVTGGILAGVGGAYYGYAANAGNNLAKFEVEAVEIAPVWTVEAADEGPEAVSQAFIPELSLYSGDVKEIPAAMALSLPDGFEVLSPYMYDPVAPATRMYIPSLRIDSNVIELSIMDLGDRRAYETPNYTVGHIPETANAGEPGSGWYFGHTESPILDEGSVFFNLQQVADELRAGKRVDIITDNGTEEFLYRVTGTRVVHEDDLVLETGDGSTIHLVSCVPRLVYDHRLIVDAELLARR